MDYITIPYPQFQAQLNGFSGTSVLARAMEDLKARFPCLVAVAGPPESYGGRGGGGGGGGGGHWGNDYEGGGGGHGGHGGGHGHHRGSRRHRHGGHGHGHGGHRKAERPRIGIRELSREDISRKDFTANMNKLSRQNYESILRLIRTTYNSNYLPNYMEILWTMMVRQPDFQDLYIQVIKHLLSITPPERSAFAHSYWTERCAAYFREKQWFPSFPDHLFSGNPNTNEEYDEFCDYIKWKKHTGASLLAWLRLMDDQVIPLHYPMCFGAILGGINDAFAHQSYKFAECLLEWFSQMVSVVASAEAALPDDIHFQLNDWLGLIKYHGLSSAMRFKIMDIQEKLMIKLK